MSEKGPKKGRGPKDHVHPVILQPTEIEQTPRGNELHIDVIGHEKDVNAYIERMKEYSGVEEGERREHSSGKSVSMSGDWSGSKWQPESPFFRKLHGNPRDN